MRRPRRGMATGRACRREASVRGWLADGARLAVAAPGGNLLVRVACQRTQRAARVHVVPAPVRPGHPLSMLASTPRWGCFLTVVLIYCLRGGWRGGARGEDSLERSSKERSDCQDRSERSESWRWPATHPMPCPQSMSTHCGVAKMGLPFSSGGTGHGHTSLALSPSHGAHDCEDGNSNTDYTPSFLPVASRPHLSALTAAIA